MTRRRLAGALAAPLVLGAGVAPAEAAAVPRVVAEALLHQAEYWRAHGRPDLAAQALGRLAAADPSRAPDRAQGRWIPRRDAPAGRGRSTAPDLTLAAQGFRRLDAGDRVGAEALFRAALSVKPADADALGGLGLVRLKANGFSDAAALLAQAASLATDGRWSDPLATARFYADLARAQAARQAGALEAAEILAGQLARSPYRDHALGAALARDIRGQRAIEARAAALAAWRQGQVDVADDRFQTAVALAPADPWIRYAYAEFLGLAHRRADAEQVMTPVLRADTPEASFAAALFLDAAGSPAAAAERLEAIPAAARTPQMRRFDSQLRCELAVSAAKALARVGRSRTAAAGLRRLAADAALPSGAVSQLADGLFEIGDAASATRLTDLVLARPLSDASDYEGVVSVLGRSGRDRDALRLIGQLAAASDGPQGAAQLKRLHARFTLGAADRRAKAGDLDPALTLLRGELAVSPDDPELLAALGRTYLIADRPDRAIGVYAALTTLRPNDQGAWRALSVAALQARDLPRARAALDRARALAPDDPEIILSAAEFDRAAGRPVPAAAGLRRALDLRERARAGELDGVLDPQIARRALPAFTLGRADEQEDDAEGQRLRARLDEAYDQATPMVQPGLGWSQRSGDSGLSQLATVTGELQAGFPAGAGRLQTTLRLVRLEAGALDGAAAQRFGVGPLTAAAAAAKTAAALPSLGASYTTDDRRFSGAVTRLTQGRISVAAEARWTPRLGRDLQADLAALRQPVTDSLLAYAGARDPRGGVAWGQVSRTGLRAGVNWARRDLGGYAVVGGYAYDGWHVRANRSAQLDVGGYARLATLGAGALTAGANVDLQAFQRNENAFTAGRGGYFSPQQFASLTVPLRYSLAKGPWRGELRVSPGYEHYREGDSPAFPTRPDLQRRLSPAQAVAPGDAKRGLGASGDGFLERSFGARVVVRAQAGFDTFGAYRESHAGLTLKARFGLSR